MNRNFTPRWDMFDIASQALGTVLVVDDKPDNLRLLANLLSEVGYGIRIAQSGERALATCQKDPPDLILLDIMMPNMNGYEVCLKLKADPQTAEIPVIFLSAVDETMDKVAAFSCGGVDYITKPFNREELIVRVKTHIDLKLSRERILRYNRQIQDELELAKEIQTVIFRREIPTFGKLAIESHCQMAELVGGDFFLFRKTDEDTLVAAIGDVSGKSIHAAMMQTLVSRELLRRIEENLPPGEVLTLVNLDLQPFFEVVQMYCTIFLLKMQVDSGAILFSNGGHPRPLLFDPKEEKVAPLDGSNFPIGVVSDTRYTTFQVRSPPGGAVLAYTDGLTDVWNENREWYTEERLIRIFSSLCRRKGGHVIPSILENVNSFKMGKEFRDDCTLFCLQRR